MTPEHELWLTALMNKLIGKPVAAMLTLMGFHPDPAHPIPDYMAAEILVVLLIVAAALVLRRRLSVENPGKFQQMMEVFYEFNRNLADDVIGHDGRRYMVLIGTLGLFVGVCNLIGIIPTMDTPSASIYLTLGCAVVAFLYYNYHGFRHHGLLGYLKHFAGPVAAISFIMFPLEIFSSTLRMLSLSVRLWANMLVGNLIEEVFAGLVPILVPALFMALHVFVSFLQAYVFMILPAVYISLAVADEH
jgi:F-type H+-transporting ATPase subunit a